MKRLTWFTLFSAGASAVFGAEAIPTHLTVRAVSRDAKIIGDGVGGARITIREKATGRVLASGIQRGATGETKKIMSEPRTRGGVVFDTPGAAAFTATLNLTAPTAVEIIAEGPLKFPQAMQRTSKTILVLPGQHIAGEGVLLEIHGFIVEILEPTEKTFAAPRTIRARLAMT